MKVKRFKLNALSKESLRQKEMSAIVGRPLVHKAKKEYMKSIIPIILCLVFFLRPSLRLRIALFLTDR